MKKVTKMSDNEVETYLKLLKGSFLGAGDWEESVELVADLAVKEVGLENCKVILAALNQMEQKVNHFPNLSYSMKNEMYKTIRKSRRLVRSIIKRHNSVEGPK